MAVDEAEILQLVVRERQVRDRGWWDELPGCYHPEATIRTSWFSGTIAEYVERSKDMHTSDPSTHRVGVPVVRAHGDRSVVELPMTIEFRGDVRGVECDLAVQIRFITRVERRDGTWRILSSEAVFEHDTLTPTMPGSAPKVTSEDLAGFRPSYRMLALWLTERGYEVGDDRLGADRPEAVEQVYREAHAWAGLTAH
ncbi:nuclear transport factor 2 family protein [Amycolatopsis rhabdoformis]|uniref:Nuclear transport factor 2 family protein n=1 Tax=Amycolatopsis rhabdoformis TaxID=1448059 RepID=A0ABZ1IKI8_9PSEU|nr:nuclear transport factor 2 family protein [Amycolatopsis rhabdoformis]WSE34704.1 nuclear transport factor 2 family protein [Amycolatopsis rhabdoformis]